MKHSIIYLVKPQGSHMISKTITRAFRRYYAGKNSEFVFLKHENPEVDSSDFDSLHLYIHIPFCAQCCPYCPYNKVAYDAVLSEQFFKALHTEIDFYHNKLGKINITSLYFGGGSPALFPEHIASVIEHVKQSFNLSEDICIEMNPNDCSLNNLQILKNAGVKTVSVGVQSFQDDNLNFIGRKYNGELAIKAVERVCSIFDSVNIDLMFALPSQNNQSVEKDIAKAISMDVNQVTCYPLFTFPYTTVGEYRKGKNVKMPKLGKRKKQYYTIYDTLTNADFDQVSVWSFKKGGGSKYSSVTRDGYLGLGAGAGTHLPHGYYLNTFSVEAYNKKLNDNKFPTAMKFALDEKLNDLFWLYWRFYDARIPIAQFDLRFAKDKRMQRLFGVLKITKMLISNNDEYVLTRRGSFWLHLAQNYFSLGYINTIWHDALNKDYPEKISF